MFATLPSSGEGLGLENIDGPRVLGAVSIVLGWGDCRGTWFVS